MGRTENRMILKKNRVPKRFRKEIYRELVNEDTRKRKEAQETKDNYSPFEGAVMKIKERGGIIAD